MDVSVLPSHMRPLQWLLGKWEAKNGEGLSSTGEPFKYTEKVEFSNIGQPVINYTATSFDAGNGTLMHMESGFIRCHPESRKIAFTTAHKFGAAMVEEGYINEDGNEIILESLQISTMSFAEVPTVMQTKRVYRKKNDEMEYIFSMATAKAPEIQAHLHVIYKRCD
ncbi:unnamed protein product [Darwinula stevensoni]|uniref:THAP4-like heme-binding domain-containing protein n=1 Tax=Darwinula stevensoni TaxID=69355 RepID=A0A7R8X8X6_9CRUS|nr:unnamed protein product [Darwinula stevensoni]CAG0890555.1 unnamed protein product [Darwinula stevensoni]